MSSNSPDREMWHDDGNCVVLGMGRTLPGAPVLTDELLAHVEQHFKVEVRRIGAKIAGKLGINARHLCRNLAMRREAPRPGHRNAELAALAVRDALRDAALHVNELGYLIGHTATPGRALPPNIAQVADLLGFDGPLLELRQACTGFANALITARGLLKTNDSKPIAIVGSETGSVYFDPRRVTEDRGQMVNMLQMGDGAAAVVIGPASCSGGRISHMYFGRNSQGHAPGLSLQYGGSDLAPGTSAPEFNHDFELVTALGPELLMQGVTAARKLGVDVSTVDYLIPHQANGRMAELLAARLGIEAQRVFVNADRVGNTGSAAIWLALCELREQLRQGQRVLILGAEATAHLYGGFVYEHA